MPYFKDTIKEKSMTLKPVTSENVMRKAKIKKTYSIQNTKILIKENDDKKLKIRAQKKIQIYQ